MGNSIKSSDLAQQLKNTDRYGFSGEEIRQAEVHLDLLDGTRDGQINLDRVSRETVAGELGKIISAKAGPIRGGVWRNAEEIAGVLTRAEAAGKEKSSRPSEEREEVPGVVEQIGDETWKDLQEFGRDLEDGFYGRSPESRYSQEERSPMGDVPSGRLVGAAAEDVEVATAGFQVFNPEVMAYQSSANQLLVALNGQFGMSPEILRLNDVLGAITDDPSPLNCKQLLRYKLSAGQKAEIESMSGVLQQAADKVKQGERLSFEERESVKAATGRVREILDAVKPVNSGWIPQDRVAVANPVRILVNQAPAAAEEAIEQAPIAVRNPVRIIVNQAPTTLRSAVQTVEEESPIIARNPVRILLNSGPATVAAAEEATAEVLRENGMNGRNVVVGTSVGAGGAGMAGVLTEVAAYGAAAAVGVGLGAAVVYSGAGEVLPVAPFVTFKQAGDWLGEAAYGLAHLGDGE